MARSGKVALAYTADSRWRNRASSSSAEQKLRILARKWPKNSIIG